MNLSGLAALGRRLAAAALVAGGSIGGLAAYETDQYSARGLELADAVEPLNDQVNAALERVAGRWRGEPDPRRFARRVYKELGGRHWVDRLERWAMRDGSIDRFDPRRRGSVYSGLPVWATRIIAFFGVGPTIRVNGVYIGTDKLGHFLSQGWKYHKRYLASGSVEHAVRLGARNEASIFGSPATGSFSNADLVANYEGLRFYRSLFEDGVIAGLPAIVAWEDGLARIARPFDFRHHVNDFWDEALNPNRYDRLLRGRMLERLERFCPDYAAAPHAWVSPDEAELRRRYAFLRMRDGRSHRLDRVCAASAAPSIAASSD